MKHWIILVYASFRIKDFLQQELLETVKLLLGMEEAKSGGKALKDAGYTFDCAHTSVLQRAQTTLKTILEQTGYYS